MVLQHPTISAKLVRWLQYPEGTVNQETVTGSQVTDEPVKDEAFESGSDNDVRVSTVDTHTCLDACPDAQQQIDDHHQSWSNLYLTTLMTYIFS